MLVWTLVTIFAAPSQAAVQREYMEGFKPNSLLALYPNKAEITVTPGKPYLIPVTLENGFNKPLDVSVSITGLGPAPDPASLAAINDDAAFSAASWITPDIQDLRMQPLERVEFNLTVLPPDNAPVGTNFAGLVVKLAPASGKPGTGDVKGTVQTQALGQLYLNIPGAQKRDLQLVSFKVDDKLFLGRSKFVVYEAKFHNNGNVNDHVTGRINISSMFGNSAASLQLRDMIILRGADRTQRIVWTDSIPWFGAFTAQLKAEGDGKQPVTGSADRVIILPPWWFFALVIAALTLPFAVAWWRRRNDWRQYLEDDWAEDASDEY